MKKFVLIMVSTLVMIIFIAFNYLLWERDGREKDIRTLQTSNENNSATINALGRDIKNLEADNKDMAQENDDMEKLLEAVRADNTRLRDENINMGDELSERKRLVDQLKQDVDTSIINAPIRKWADSIDKAEYETAFDLQYGYFVIAPEGSPGLGDFTDFYKKYVKSMNIKSIGLKLKDVPASMAGMIIFEAVVDIELSEGQITVTDKYIDLRYAEGPNEFYFTITYDEVHKKWVIGSISHEL